MNSYSKIVRTSALYDLVITSAFALPIIAGLKVELLYRLHNHLGLAGNFPEFAPMHLLFVNFTGSVVIIWSLVRIHQPLAFFGLYDGICRLLFSLAMAYALFAGNGTALIWIFLLPEAGWALVQLLGYLKFGSSNSLSGQQETSLTKRM